MNLKTRPKSLKITLYYEKNIGKTIILYKKNQKGLRITKKKKSR